MEGGISILETLIPNGAMAYVYIGTMIIISLSITVIVHELGHFGVARKYGINAPEIGIGFRIPGKPDFCFKRKIRNVSISINPVPFGAFVAIGTEDIGKLNSAFKEIMVYAAGSLSNIALGVISICILGVAKGAGIIEAFIGSIKLILFVIVSMPVAILNLELSTPIGVVSVITHENGIMQMPGPILFLLLLAIINISIGVANLMIAIPPLDGGHIIFTILEKIFGKNRMRNFRAISSFIGVMFILGLTIFALYKDMAALF